VIICLRPIQGIGAHEAQTKEQVEVCHALPPVGHAALVRLGLSGRYARWGDIVDSAEDERIVCRVVDTRSGENRGEKEAGRSADPSCGSDVYSPVAEEGQGTGNVLESSGELRLVKVLTPESVQRLHELRLVRLLRLASVRRLPSYTFQANSESFCTIMLCAKVMSPAPSRPMNVLLAWLRSISICSRFPTHL
jgi:hypothetical protein